MHLEAAAHFAIECIWLSAWLSLLFALAYALSDAGRSRVIALLFSLIGVVLLHGYLIMSRGILNFPWFLQVHVPAIYLLGPVSFRWLSELLKDNVKFRWYDFVPAVLAALFLAPVYFSDVNAKRAMATSLIEGHGPFAVRIVFGLGLVSFLIYLIRAALLFLPFFRNASFVHQRSVRIGGFVLLYAGTISVIAAVALFWNALGVLLVMLTGLALFPPAVYLIAARYPDLFYELQQVVRKGHYEYSRLSGHDLDDLKSRLANLMQTERLFVEEGIAIEDVADRLGLSVHALSEFFNNHLKTNFSGYINSMRIIAACKIMESQPDRTVLSVAYEVGFSAKSTFNAAFLRHTGVSPSAFRKQKRPSV
ncbi:MAG: helix-turn-helix domain-containing protein [Spirochaetia bacterium]|nr:helix-turn-helix domain-containing protein [Spirochaetia bacterium]